MSAPSHNCELHRKGLRLNLPRLFRGGWSVLPGPLEGLGEQLSNGVRQYVVAGSNDDFDGWEVIEESLATTTAWSQYAPIAISHGHDSLQVVVALRCGSTNHHQFCARAASEMVSVYACDDVSVPTSSRRGDRVVVSPAKGLRHISGCLYEFVVNLARPRIHWTMIPQVTPSCLYVLSRCPSTPVKGVPCHLITTGYEVGSSFRFRCNGASDGESRNC